MKGSLYAAFMERRGRRVYEAAGCYWYGVDSGLIMSIPYHEPMEPPAEEVLDLLKRRHLIGARYLAQEGNGLPGGLYVRRKGPYDIHSVHRMSRNRVRRGLAQCNVRGVEKSELEGQGLDLNLDTMKRQGRFDPEFGEAKQWRRLVEACYASRGVEVVGAFVGGSLAAYTVTMNEDRWLHVLHAFSSAQFINEQFPSKALAFTLTKRAADDPGLDVVTYGVAGLVHGPGLHEFKVRLGYEFIPYGYAFLLHPAARLALVNPLLAWGIRAARRTWPGAQKIERLESVVNGARMTSPDDRRPLVTEEIRIG